jgi:hypothetical protein
MPPKKIGLQDYNLTELAKADSGLQWFFIIGGYIKKEMAAATRNYQSITEFKFSDLSRALETLLPYMFKPSAEADTFLKEQIKNASDIDDKKRDESNKAKQLHPKQGPIIKQTIERGREFIKYVSFLFDYAYRKGEGDTYAHRIKSILDNHPADFKDEFKNFAMVDSAIINNYFENARVTLNTIPPHQLQEKLRKSHAMILATVGHMLGEQVTEFQPNVDTAVRYYDHPDTTAITFIENADGTIATGAHGERMLHVDIHGNPADPETPETPPPPPPADAAATQAGEAPTLLRPAAVQAGSPPALLTPEAVQAAAASQADDKPDLKEEGIAEKVIRALGINTEIEDDWIKPPKDRSKVSLAAPKYQLRGLESNLRGHKINLSLPKITLCNKINLLL